MLMQLLVQLRVLLLALLRLLVLTSLLGNNGRPEAVSYIRIPIRINPCCTFRK